MKKITLLIILGSFVMMSCGPRGKEAQLQRLEKQRNALNEQIEQLKAELFIKSLRFFNISDSQAD